MSLPVEPRLQGFVDTDPFEARSKSSLLPDARERHRPRTDTDASRLPSWPVQPAGQTSLLVLDDPTQAHKPTHNRGPSPKRGTTTSPPTHYSTCGGFPFFPGGFLRFFPSHQQTLWTWRSGYSRELQHRRIRDLGHGFLFERNFQYCRRTEQSLLLELLQT